MALKSKFRSIIQASAAHYAMSPEDNRSFLAGRPSIMGPLGSMSPVVRCMTPSSKKSIRVAAAKWCQGTGFTASRLTKAIRAGEDWILSEFILLQDILAIPTLLKKGRLQNMLSASFKDAPLELWRDLQKLHDQNPFWRGRAHSPAGKLYVKYMLDKWSDVDRLREHANDS